jgi:hypothetical protein
MRLFLPLICLWLATLSARAEPFLFRELREGDRASHIDGRIVVYSKTGIGKATIVPTQDWAAQVTIRFCYEDGRGMTRIEGLELSTQTLKVQGSFRDTERMPFSFVGSGPEKVAGMINVTFRVVNGALELSLPANFARHADSVTVSWIDAYR